MGRRHRGYEESKTAASKAFQCSWLLSLSKSMSTSQRLPCNVLTTAAWAPGDRSAVLKGECTQAQQIRVCHSLSLKCVVQLTSLQNFLSSNSKWIHLYMRSISISGSSWNSLIFTVSDRMLFRLHSSSSTWSNTKINVQFSGVCFFLLEKQQHLHLMMLLPLSLFYPKKISGCFFQHCAMWQRPLI